MRVMHGVPPVADARSVQGAMVTIDQCKILGSRGDGVDARGDGSSVLIKCTMIEDNGNSGVAAQRQVGPPAFRSTCTAQHHPRRHGSVTCVLWACGAGAAARQEQAPASAQA